MNLIHRSIMDNQYPAHLHVAVLYLCLQIGRCDLAIVLDCDEYYCKQRLSNRHKDTGRIDDNENAIEARIVYFKEHSLPAIKFFDDKECLLVVSLLLCVYCSPLKRLVM